MNQNNLKIIYDIFIASEKWYEFGNVDNKLLFGLLTGLGSMFFVYLFYTPRKVIIPKAIDVNWTKKKQDGTATLQKYIFFFL